MSLSSVRQARDTVIIEVNREYQFFDRILGEHRWAEFLHKPSAEEKDRVTQVFYCTYHTGRMVQKYGESPRSNCGVGYIHISPNALTSAPRCFHIN